MAWLRRAVVVVAAAALLAAAATLAEPDPPAAKANLACDVGISPGAAVTGAIGIGNPVGDACDAITDPVLGAAEDAVVAPIKDAAESVGKSVFSQVTAWATDGAVWLLGEIVELTEATTSPHLVSKGFLRQYRQMAAIAVVLALAMLIFAVLEGLGRGDAGMLWRVFLVNVPVAALATSAAYVVVQLLVATTDGFCEVIAHTTGNDSREFFKGAIEGLAAAGADTGQVVNEAGGADGTIGRASGSVAAPLFVGFLAAIVAAFAAFLVWIELLMRSAAIYAVALFMPLALAASIWPRWMSALRRTGELVVVVVFSKFVIVAVLALAASLAAHGKGVEQVLTAGALLLLACFAPFVLFKLVPFAEGAASAAFQRQSAAGGAVNSVQFASSVQMMRRSAMANWAGGGGASGASGGGKGGAATGGAAKGGAGKASGGGGASAGAGGSAGAAGAAAVPVAVAVGTAKAAQGAGQRLAGSGTGQAAAGGDSGSGGAGGAAEVKGGAGSSQKASPPPGGRDGAPREGGASERGAVRGGSPGAAEAKPSEAPGGSPPGREAKTPRPTGDAAGGSNKGSPTGKGKP